MNKTINIGEGTNGRQIFADRWTNSVDIRQTIVEHKPDGISIGGVSLTSGYGWGVDVGIVLIIVAALYVAKKMIDKWIK